MILYLIKEGEMNIKRLNYIGSKYQLLDWITHTITSKTGWESFENKKIGDFFGGTGVVSYQFRILGAEVYSNDSEKYSSIICHALTKSRCTERCLNSIEKLKDKTSIGFITKEYSPYNGNQRMFFTVENAMKIDGIREALSTIENIDEDEFKFLLASLVLSADAVSNVPAVYGCYLKNFKQKAKKDLVFTPIHLNSEPANGNSCAYNSDALTLVTPKLDAVYLDPPYNERQYSKNYFPLNMIIEESLHPLKGKTGIPEECFLSGFCRKGQVLKSFETLIGGINAEWIFLSYSNESLVMRDDIVALLEKFGTVTVEERDYKRFKSFKYNGDEPIVEYLFCLQKNNV